MNRNAAVGGKVSARDSGLGKPFPKSLEKKEEFGSLWEAWKRKKSLEAYGMGFKNKGLEALYNCEIPKAG